jgi:uncharacterized protein YcfL
MKSIGQGIVQLFALLLLISCGSNKDEKDKMVVQEVKTMPSDTVSATVSPQNRKPIIVPKYKIVHTGTSYSDLDVLIHPINLNNIDYKSNVEAILDDIATKRHDINFRAYFYDNEQASELNYIDLEKGKRLTKLQNDLVNKHIIATFGKEEDGEVRISYFENIDEDTRKQYTAWAQAFNQAEFDRGFTPTIR